MQIQGISHITFVMRDLEKMATFLCKGLGATEVYDSSAKSYSISREKFFMLVGVWLAAMEGEPPAVRTYRHLASRLRRMTWPPSSFGSAR